MNLTNISILTILCYLLAALKQGYTLFGRLKQSPSGYFATALLCLMLHLFILYQLIEMPEGQNLNWLIMFSFMLWLMNLLIFFTALKSPVENLQVLTFPLSAFSIALVLCFGNDEIINTKSHPGMIAHIFISLFAMSLFSLASVQGTLMGLQNYLLKHHHPSPMLRILPPLQSMENLLFTIIWCGVILLSATLLTGFFFGYSFTSNSLLPKTLLSLGAWFLFILLLVGRYCFGWRGLTAIRWTLSGTCLTLISYFGTKALA